MDSKRSHLLAVVTSIETLSALFAFDVAYLCYSMVLLQLNSRVQAMLPGPRQSLVNRIQHLSKPPLICLQVASAPNVTRSPARCQ
jgi:hypothetical protein